MFKIVSSPVGSKKKIVKLDSFSDLMDNISTTKNVLNIKYKDNQGRYIDLKAIQTDGKEEIHDGYM